ncbi:MAG: hypothetical protein KAS32_05215 [Candidatus Peribacteraceae bacterium]|nr:hypothetical protein [Candidatus Peribacteraceae bacterium]
MDYLAKLCKLMDDEAGEFSFRLDIPTGMCHIHYHNINGSFKTKEYTLKNYMEAYEEAYKKLKDNNYD